MSPELIPDDERVGRRAAKSLMTGLLYLTATVLAAIAVVLPWPIRIRYSAFLRRVRDLLMQNSRAVRRWALRERWSWDSDDE